MLANNRLIAFALAMLSLASIATVGANEAPKSATPTVVLVHGAFADGSSWSKVIPLLEAKGVKVVAVQNGLNSLADDVAATKRAIEAQPGRVVLVGHSWGGTVITEAGGEEQVAALVYVAAFAPDIGQSTGELGKNYPPPPGLSHIMPDKAGYLSLTDDGMAKYFAQDLPANEKALMLATQAPVNSKAFDDKVSIAAWRNKPSWYVVSQQDNMIDPGLEQAFAKKINATVTSLPTSHVAMLSRPMDVAKVILAAVAAASN